MVGKFDIIIWVWILDLLSWPIQYIHKGKCCKDINFKMDVWSYVIRQDQNDDIYDRVLLALVEDKWEKIVWDRLSMFYGNIQTQSLNTSP